MIAIISLALVSHVALADGPLITPHLPGTGTGTGGIIICDPATNPDCGKLVATSPSGGQIEPDPTRTVSQCEHFGDFKACMASPDTINAFNDETGVGYVFAFDHADHELYTYAQILVNADLTGGLDFSSTLADLDGDGALDLVLGVPHESSQVRDGGALYVFYGPVLHSEFRAERPDAVLYGTIENGELGLSVARLAGEKGPDGLRANGPREGMIYTIPSTGELPEKLTKEYLR